MADYTQLKVPELKELLQERGLVQSGNKAALIARLQEDDTKKGSTGTAGEDEIDWDEDDKPTTEPAAAAVAAGGQGPIQTPIAVPNQKVDLDPSTTSDLAVKPPSPPAESTTAAEPSAAENAPKPDFSIGLQKSDAQIEAEKRAARAKRFGLPVSEEEKKLAERAKKFGLGDGKTEAVVKGLDSALPERKQKRGREERGAKEGERAAKRQTPDRRTGPNPKSKGGNAPVSKGGKKGEKKTAGGIADDPVEKAKMEARAKKFAKPATA